MPTAPDKVGLHPATGLLLALLSMMAVSLGNSVHFILVLSVIAGLYLRLCLLGKSRVLFNGLKMLRRLRWFFLSIVFVYGWMGSVSGNHDGWLGALLPDPLALQGGLYRIAVIAVFTLTINLLLATASREELVEGLYFLLYPFRLMGVPVERVIIRIVMVLDVLEEALTSLTLMRTAAAGGEGGWLQRVTKAGGEAYGYILEKAGEQEVRVIEFSIGRPSGWEYVLPAAVVALFLML